MPPKIKKLNAEGEEPKPTAQETYLFYAIIKHMKGKPEIDWDGVAQFVGLKNADTAKSRYGQVRRKLGIDNWQTKARAAKKGDDVDDDGYVPGKGSIPSTPTSARAYKFPTPGTGAGVKKRTVGTANKKTPSRAAKTRANIKLGETAELEHSVLYDEELDEAAHDEYVDAEGEEEDVFAADASNKRTADFGQAQQEEKKMSFAFETEEDERPSRAGALGGDGANDDDDGAPASAAELIAKSKAQLNALSAAIDKTTAMVFGTPNNAPATVPVGGGANSAYDNGMGFMGLGNVHNAGPTAQDAPLNAFEGLPNLACGGAIVGLNHMHHGGVGPGPATTAASAHATPTFTAGSIPGLTATTSIPGLQAPAIPMTGLFAPPRPGVNATTDDVKRILENAVLAGVTDIQGVRIHPAYVKQTKAKYAEDAERETKAAAVGNMAGNGDMTGNMVNMVNRATNGTHMTGNSTQKGGNGTMVGNGTVFGNAGANGSSAGNIANMGTNGNTGINGTSATNAYTAGNMVNTGTNGTQALAIGKKPTVSNSNGAITNGSNTNKNGFAPIKRPFSAEIRAQEQADFHALFGSGFGLNENFSQIYNNEDPFPNSAGQDMDWLLEETHRNLADFEDDEAKLV
ncbi:hypothetical protein VTJ49DRAFT_7099 [Mycothermus thermophilus]|uniref:Myb-like domain-containing protein n=1 Tax=Humicola insolens TaxID=85995 RepID=A0ABR3VHX0_HUMIN